MADVPGELVSRLERYRQLAEEPPRIPLTLQQVAELREALAWLLDNDSILETLHHFLEENRELKAKLRSTRDWLVAMATSPEGLVADLNALLGEEPPG